MNEEHPIARFPSNQEFLAALDVEAGWPPRFRQRLDKESGPSDGGLKFGPTGLILDVETRRMRIRTALLAPEIQPNLTARWGILGVHRLNTPSAEVTSVERLQICFFDYTRNVLKDIQMANGVVEKVVQGMPHQHPESAMEVAQAVAIARSHPDLAPNVRELTPHGILLVPTDVESPSCGHRCIHVIFTEADDPQVERAALFSALVDLTLQQVVSLGSCACQGGPSETIRTA